jgi:hypothetical protein
MRTAWHDLVRLTETPSGSRDTHPCLLLSSRLSLSRCMSLPASLQLLLLLLKAESVRESTLVHTLCRSMLDLFRALVAAAGDTTGTENAIGMTLLRSTAEPPLLLLLLRLLEVGAPAIHCAMSVESDMRCLGSKLWAKPWISDTGSLRASVRRPVHDTHTATWYTNMVSHGESPAGSVELSAQHAVGRVFVSELSGAPKSNCPGLEAGGMHHITRQACQLAVAACSSLIMSTHIIQHIPRAIWATKPACASR